MSKKTIYWIVGILLFLWLANGIFFTYVMGGFKKQEFNTIPIG